MVRVGGGEDSVGGNESGDERGGESEYRIARERSGGGGGSGERRERLVVLVNCRRGWRWDFWRILRLLEGLMGFLKRNMGKEEENRESV